MVEAAKEAVEHVAQRGGVLVTGGAAAVVGGFDRRRWQRAEDPYVAGCGEALVFHLAVVHQQALAGGDGDRRRAGVGLQAAGVAEPGAVVVGHLAVLFPLFMWLAIVCDERRITDLVAAGFAVGLGLRGFMMGGIVQRPDAQARG